MNTNLQLASLSDFNHLEETTDKTYGYGRYYLITTGVTPWNDVRPSQVNDLIGLPSWLQVNAVHMTKMGNQNQFSYYDHSRQQQVTKNLEKLLGEPWFIQVRYADYEHDDTRPQINDTIQSWVETLSELHIFHDASHNCYHGGGYYGPLGSATVAAMVKIKGVQVPMILPCKIAEKLFGLKITPDMKVTAANGVNCVLGRWQHILTDLNAYRHQSYRDKIQRFDFTFDTLDAVAGRMPFDWPNIENFLRGVVQQKWEVPVLKLDGIKKLYQKIEPLLPSLMTENPLSFVALRSLIAGASRTIDGVKVSGVFNDLFKDVTTKDEMVTLLEDFYKPKADDDNGYRRQRLSLDEAIRNVDTYRAKRKAVLKSKAHLAFSKLMNEAESLNIDKKRYKKTWETIEAGEIPIGTFFRKSEQYFILNDNWDLWEKMLAEHKEVACELAKEVSGRTTYEKDLMSYFYFVLHGLPEYLRKQTRCKWKCIPRLVASESELEAPAEDDTGVVRSRSALTPIVDNVAKTVTVPYASLACSGGYGTTYCYSHDYHVLTKGFSFNGNAVMNDVEEKLNGRDDYGLMFYTLTGSYNGRGYPTFLIIFERRSKFEDTRVHFHRTHPSRSKDGDYNPIHNWVRVCYNWMAGNINKETIKAQQGDLFFVEVTTHEAKLEGCKVVSNLVFDKQVDSYDSHCFEQPVPFAAYTKAAKSNILGYVQFDKPTLLTHPEHDHVTIPAGTFAIHQCRSWEANPHGVWSLRID